MHRANYPVHRDSSSSTLPRRAESRPEVSPGPACHGLSGRVITALRRRRHPSRAPLVRHAALPAPRRLRSAVPTTHGAWRTTATQGRQCGFRGRRGWVPPPLELPLDNRQTATILTLGESHPRRATCTRFNSARSIVWCVRDRRSRVETNVAVVILLVPRGGLARRTCHDSPRTFR